MIKAIFFDFNGVIIDDEPLQMAAYQQGLRDYGIDLTPSEYYGAMGMDDKHFVRAAFAREKKQLADEVLQIILERKAADHRKLIEDELPLFPGAITFLKATSRHYSLALVSMATMAEIEYTLNRARLRSLFSVIVSAENVNVCKPAPDCYRVALEELNNRRGEGRLLPLLPRECLVIEDSPPGIESGKQAGMRTLAVTNTVSTEALRAAGAEVVTASLADWTVDAVYHVFSEG
jgi:HAD superfamily hydrolase (TIGR01509 family)